LRQSSTFTDGGKSFWREPAEAAGGFARAYFPFVIGHFSFVIEIHKPLAASDSVNAK
jgi:hypothetical protein